MNPTSGFYFPPHCAGGKMGLTLALPLGGMKAKVEYHTLTSPEKPYTHLT